MDVNEGTEERGNTDARDSTRVIRIAAVLASCGFIGLALARIAANDLGFAPEIGAAGVLSLLTIWINHRGRPMLAGVILMTLLVGTSVFLMTSSEGIHDAALLTFPGILVLAALIFPRRLYVVLAALLVLIPAIVGTLELTKMIITPYSARTDLLSLVDITVILFMTAAAVELMTRIVKESSSRARSSEARFRLLFNNSSERRG